MENFFAFASEGQNDVEDSGAKLRKELLGAAAWDAEAPSAAFPGQRHRFLGNTLFGKYAFWEIRFLGNSPSMVLRAVCLWPGLPAAWMLGLARGLLIAVVYAWCICGLLLATFVWPDWVAASWLRLLWLAAIGTWGWAAISNCFRLSTLLATWDTQSCEALVTAQQEYLRGNWFDAEASVLQVLHHHPRDAEALLLLVGILRRTQRYQPALRRLAQLDLLEPAAKWHFEIQREKKWIARAIAEAANAETAPELISQK